MANGHAQLAVPGGSNHDAFVGGNNSVRILQPVGNSDFDVAAKFDSNVSQPYEGEGILVVQNSTTYIRFEIAGTGGQSSLSAALVSGGTQTHLASANAPAFSGSLWLQVQRSGNAWTFSSSTDGTNYTTAGSFTQTFTLAQIGPYAWNYNGNPSASPALTASVDYFHTLASSTTAAPTFNPASGTTFTSSLSVSLSDSTPGATIYYTLDNSTPTQSSLVYTGPISITATTTVKAIAAASGLQASSVAAASYTEVAAAGGAPVSDDFNGTSLNTSLWTASMPAGGSVTVSNGHAMLAVPGGSNHDAFVGGDNAVRILQNIANSDFDVAAKFDSNVSQPYQGEGVLVVQNSTTYMRFEIGGNGGQSLLSAALVSGGTQTQLASANAPAFNGSLWLQVQRSGSTWTFSSSTDGTNYTTAGSFNQNITVAQIGPYAWNYNGNASASPALTASVDYFYNLGTNTSPPPPVISNVAAAPNASGAVITWMTNISATSVVNYGTTAGYGSTVTNSSLVTSHSLTLTGLICGTGYNYDVSSTSGTGQTSTSSNATFTTAACPGGGAVGQFRITSTNPP